MEGLPDLEHEQQKFATFIGKQENMLRQEQEVLAIMRKELYDIPRKEVEVRGVKIREI